MKYLYLIIITNPAIEQHLVYLKKLAYVPNFHCRYKCQKVCYQLTPGLIQIKNLKVRPHYFGFHQGVDNLLFPWHHISALLSALYCNGRNSIQDRN